MRLRIGYYLSSNAMGGQERHVLTLIDYFRAKHDVTVFCHAVAGYATFAEELNKRNLQPTLLPRRRMSTRGVLRPVATSLPVVVSASKILAAAELDVVHFHAGLLGRMYAPALGSLVARVPTRILTLHNPVRRHRWLRRSIDRRALRSFTRIVAVSEHIKQNLVDKKGLAPEDVRVIPNGVRLSDFPAPADRAEARVALGLSTGDIVAGAVGRLDEVKGVDLLIRAAAAIKARVPQLKIVFIGSGPEEAALKRLAAETGVADAVRFLGYRSDARALFHALDVLALPSRHEAQSLSLLEAMACAKPVVASNVGGIPDVVRDGVTGILFPSENVGAFAAALLRLLEDEETRAAMGAAARERVRLHFSEDTMLEQTASLYEQRRSGAARFELAAGDPR